MTLLGDGRHERTMPELTATVFTELRNLVRAELERGRLEGKQRLGAAARGAVWFTAAAVAAGFGAVCLVVAAVAGLSTVLNRPWFAAVIVAAVAGGTALFIVLPGWRGILQRHSPAPDRSLLRIRADMHALLGALRRRHS